MSVVVIVIFIASLVAGAVGVYLYSEPTPTETGAPVEKPEGTVPDEVDPVGTTPPDNGHPPENGHQDYFIREYFENVPSAALSALERAGIEKVSDIEEYDDFQKIDGIGPAREADIRAELEE